MKTCLSVMLIRQGWWPLISSICSQVRRIWVNHCDKDDIKSDSTSMRFSYETFIATSKDCMTNEVVSLFLSIQWSTGVFNDWLPNQSTSTIIGSHSTDTYHWGGSGHFNLSYHLSSLDFKIHNHHLVGIFQGLILPWLQLVQTRL